jgi:uncharacterized protein YqgC (DUF456 family)
MDILWWSLTLALMFAGLLGTFVPILPGAALIFAGAVLNRLALGPEQSVGWGTLAGLMILMFLSYLIEFLSGTLGARYFGATRWGILGGIAGAIVGLFFGLPGLIIGPLLGVLLGELVAGQKLLPATKATWGTLIGTAAGMIAKLVIALGMITWFAVAVMTRG